MNSCFKPGILDMFVNAVVVQQNVCCLLPVGQGNAARGVVHEMVLAEWWTPEDKNLLNLILCRDTYPALVLI